MEFDEGENAWTWPGASRAPDVIWYTYKDVVKHIKLPEPILKTIMGRNNVVSEVKKFYTF